jgi:hypothetical protein
VSGWITPPNPNVAADYWVTRRGADAAPGYGSELPDIRERFRWNGNGAWLTGDYYYDHGRKIPDLVLLPSDNGWRIEGAAQ